MCLVFLCVGKRLTCNAGGRRTAAGRAHQHRRGQITALGIPSRSPQLTFPPSGGGLAQGTGRVAVAVLDSGGHRSDGSGYKADCGRSVVGAADNAGQADTIEAARTCM